MGEGLGIAGGVMKKLPIDDTRYESDEPANVEQAHLPLFVFQPKEGEQLELFK